MDRPRLAALVEGYVEQAAVPELTRYGAIPCLSPSFDPDWRAHGHLDQAAELVRAFAAHRPLGGVRADVLAAPGRTPVVLVEVPATDPARDGETTLVYGHLDKQPPLGTWRAGLDPFRPVRDGDRLYGRGLADDGYAAFAALGALESLESLGEGHGRVVVLIEASEESGSPDLEPSLDLVADRLGQPALVVCLDSGGPTYDRLWLTSSLRGNLVVTLTVEVLTEGVHSGHAGGIVPDSFRLARQLLDRVEDPATGRVRLPGLHVQVPPHRRQEIAAVAAELGAVAAGAFPTVPGLRLASPDPADRIELATWHPSLTVIGADGLPAVADGGNVLRPATSLKCSLRLPPTCDAAAALAALEEALTADPPDGATVRLHADAPAQGWDAPALSPALSARVEAASIAHFGAPARVLGLGGSIPFLAALGTRYPSAQLLATGVLGPGSNAHGPNEVLELGALKSLTACLAELLAATPS